MDRNTITNRVRWQERFNLLVYCAVAYWIWFSLSDESRSLFDHRLIVIMGILGIWRYGWWFTNFIRALIYQHMVFPRWREKSEGLWQAGWRPPHVYFVIATYKEDRDTTENLLSAMLRECRHLNVPATLYLGASAQDELIVRDFVQYHARNMDFKVVAVRQTLPDKRIALGQCLRSMSRHGVVKDAPVILMDGDVIMQKNCLKDCTPFFSLFPKMDALTTHEAAIFNGPKWMADMTEMRFTQRHLMMQSHALSKRVMTLTGRLSIFRSQAITDADFIDRLENDYLNHWLWGTFRFLSGDDKTTWFWLLKKRSEMLYIPDVKILTVEHVQGNGVKRTFQNLMRWSGNMLRNNGRAIGLGPRVVPPFIWWCLVDQRLVIWTSLVSPVAAILVTLQVGLAFLPVYLLWLAGTRLLLSSILFAYAGRINMRYPFLLYLLQVGNALVKVFMIFHLPRQKWSNRASITGSYVFTPHKQAIALLIMSTYIALFIFALGLYVGNWSVLTVL